MLCTWLIKVEGSLDEIAVETALLSWVAKLDRLVNCVSWISAWVTASEVAV